MPPDAVVDVAVLYSITKAPHVIELIRNLGSAMRDLINEAIDNLQFNPRPPGHRPMVPNSPILTVTVDTQPKYLLVYQVNDEQPNVVVLALQPTVSRT